MKKKQKPIKTQKQALLYLIDFIGKTEAACDDDIKRFKPLKKYLEKFK